MEETETQPEAKESQFSLYSDLERLSDLLNKAQNLSLENNKFNPAKIRDYFVVLKEIYRFVFPLLENHETTKKITETMKKLDNVTIAVQRKLLDGSEYKVPVDIFQALDIFHSDLMIWKQHANLGIQTKRKFTSTQKLKNSLE